MKTTHPLPAGLLALTTALAVPAMAKSPHSIAIEPISSIAAGSFLQAAAEIAAYDPVTKRTFVVNAQEASVDVISIVNPAVPVLIDSIDVTPYGAVANSVAVQGGVIAVAVEAAVKTSPGKVVFFNSALAYISEVTVGALPDMLTFTPDGKTLVVANEGEPASDYSIDPEGSVSVIDMSKGPTRARVRTAGFEVLNGLGRDALFNCIGEVAVIRIFGFNIAAPIPARRHDPKPAIRVFGPESTVSQNLEPEYLTVSKDSKTAWVTLQEANALAIIDLPSASLKSLVGLGVKDHSLPGNGLDASDRDGIPVANAGRINIQNWPVYGIYQPDTIASWQDGKNTYLLLANEGDTRDWEAYSEETRIGSMDLDPAVFPEAVASELKKTGNLGRLKATTAQGDTGGNEVFKEIYTFGTRSFSIRDAAGRLVWDSGDQFEQIIAAENPDFFNSNHEINKFDDRSDDKGPEPEAIAVGKVFGRNYAFIGLERVGGIMVYDITEPTEPFFVQYINNRDFAQEPDSVLAGDLGPEGIVFISGDDSPNGKPLLVVSNEVSGTTTFYEISKVKGGKN